MPAALLSKYTVRRVIGESRLNRLLNAGWIAPVGSGQFDPRDVRKAITRLERERPPANKIEVARVRASEARNGHPRTRKVKPPRPTIWDLKVEKLMSPTFKVLYQIDRK